MPDLELKIDNSSTIILSLSGYKITHYPVKFLYSILMILFFLSASANLYAQEDLCQNIFNEKALKYYKEGADKKNKKDKRMEFLKKAIDLEPDFVAANCLFGIELARTLNYEKASLEPCAKYFQVVLDSCPEFHSDPYYYMGEIMMARENYLDAAGYYKKFMNFKSDDDDRFSRDYDKKIEKAKEDYKVARFYGIHLNKKVPFEPVVVEGMNTEFDEYLALISPDDEKMYFTQRLKIKQKIQRSIAERDDIAYTELFVNSTNTNGAFSEPALMPFPFNMDPEANYGGATISIDNKHLFFTICSPGKMGYTNCDIYSSDYIYGFNEKNGETEWHWSELQNLGPNVNTPDGWESQPSLSADGRTLYFASFRDDSKMIDVYSTRKQQDGTWGLAENLGAPINTDYNDKSPFIHSDSQTLYFSSDGHMGFGGYDIFYARADDEGKWIEPVNIGFPINNEGDQHGFVVSTDGSTVYFSSNNYKDIGKGGFDVLSFELYKEARPEHVVFLKGTVKDEHGEVIKDAKLEMKNIKTNQVTEFDVDTVDGSYAAVVTLKEDQDVVLSIKAENKVFNSHYYSAKDTVKPTFTELEVELEHIHPGKPFRLNDIYFNTSSAVLIDESKAVLDEFAGFLKEHADLEIAIHGHTDNNGESESNLHLSTDRAYSVLAYLQSHGIDKERLSFQGFGEKMPIATNDTPEGRALNRRTEFLIVKNGE